MLFFIAGMKPIKYATAFVIYKENRSEFLIVQRPFDDEDLPNIWGLPAGSVKENESFKEAVIRSGREKLGIELKVIKSIGKDIIDRGDYILNMQEYEVEIISGEPRVPQLIQGITQYQHLLWGNSSDLKDAANKGSLCSRIYLTSINERW